MRPVLLAAACLTACEGLIGELPIVSPSQPPAEEATEPVPGTIDRKPLCAGEKTDVLGPRLLRRLTSAELEAALRAGLRLSASDWAGPALPPDPSAKNGFTNHADRLLVNDTVAERLFETAKAVGALVAAEPRLSALSPCARNGDEACARTFLDTVGRRIYRRPLTEAERARYMALYARIVPRFGFAKWVEWATVALVQSPHSMYRFELGTAVDGTHRLTPYQTASLLAFTYTGGPPDDALLALAASGGLETPEQLVGAARGLALDDAGKLRPAAREVLLRFQRQWLNLPKLEVLTKRADKYPLWSDAVRTSMRREVQAFFAHVVEQKGSMADLLTAPYTFVDMTLASYYGFGGAGAGSELTMAARPAEHGVGLLGQGALLAIRADNESTSPTQRGHFVKTHVLCSDPPPPPPNVGPLPPPSAANTTRERYEKAHAGNPQCSGCHRMMDPIGSALEHFDAAGRYRATENGYPIDDSGVLFLDGKEVSFKGQVELSRFLASQPRSAECLAAYLASFAFGLDHHDTACLVSSAAQGFARGRSIVDYYVDMAGTPHFSRRASN